MTPKKKLLDTFENPQIDKDYLINMKIPEFTCLCPLTAQPDFAEFVITYIPDKLCVELKSLKLYLQQYREVVISYERLLNQLYEHLQEVYIPARLRIVLDCNPRGGISSRLTIDSDWEALGGKEEYKEWREDTW